MMTRSKVQISELELKLSNALEDLKVSRELNKQLLLEREDSELEVKNQSDRLAQLKKQLISLSEDHVTTCTERDDLKLKLGSYDQCMSTYEKALETIQNLEEQLAYTNNMLQQERSEKEERKSDTTMALYAELVNCSKPRNSFSDYSLTPLNTEDNNKLYEMQNCVVTLEREIFELEIKHKKIVAQKDIYIRQLKLETRDINKKYCSALEKIHEYEMDMQEMLKISLDMDKIIDGNSRRLEALSSLMSTPSLPQAQIQPNHKESSKQLLKSPTREDRSPAMSSTSMKRRRRRRAARQGHGAEQAAPESTTGSGTADVPTTPRRHGGPRSVLVPTSNTTSSPAPAAPRRRGRPRKVDVSSTLDAAAPRLNHDIPRKRGRPLNVKANTASHTPARQGQSPMTPRGASPPPTTPTRQGQSPMTPRGASPAHTTAGEDLRASADDRTPTPASTPCKTIVFSDRIGVGLGSLLKYKLNQNVTNICLPGASYSQIVEAILSTKYDKNTTVVILIGNSYNVNKIDMRRCFEYLLASEVKKIINCAFPYSKLMTESHKNYVYNLNLCMFNMTFGHRDRSHYFDTNNFIRNFILTRDTLNVSMYIKRRLATLLAYNIPDQVISKITYCFPTVSRNTNILTNNPVNTVDVTKNVIHCFPIDTKKSLNLS